MFSCKVRFCKILSLAVGIQIFKIAVPEPARAQPITSSSNANIFLSYSQLIFRQNLNIYDWLYSLNYKKSLTKKLDFKIKEDFQSTLQSVSNSDLWKDTQNLNVRFDYSFPKSVQLNADFFSHIQSDPLAGFDNDVIFYSGSAGVRYQPSTNFFVASNVSSKWQSQLDRSDIGFGYGFDAQIIEANLSGYRNNFNFSGSQDFFPLRRNEDFKLRYLIKREFYQSTADTLSIFFDRLRRDNFDLEAGSYFVRKLTQNSRGFENRLSYKVSESATLFLTNYVASNSFRVDNIKVSDTTDVRKDDAGFESKHSVNLTFFKRPKWFNRVGWSFSLKTRDDRRVVDKPDDPFGERHPSRGFDTDEVFVKLDWVAGVRIAAADSFGWFSSVSKFKYDTSDTLAPNNHDQIRWQMTISYQHIFHPSLKLLWRSSVFLNHLVYISGQFSSGNNWERVIQLTPVVFYKPSDKFTFQQSFTVRAKYQTYDFDDPVTSTRNLANRQFIMSNITNLAVSNITRIELAGSLELAEQGKLYYDDWHQQLALSWRTEDLQLLIKNQLGTYITLSVGGNLFHQIRWNHRLNSEQRLEKMLRDEHINIGPVLEVFFRPSSSLELAFVGNTQVVYSTKRKREQINRFDLNLNWFF